MFLLLAVIAVGVQAQKMFVDKQDDGFRVCQTYAKKVCSIPGFLGGRVLYAGIQCFAYEKGDTIYKLSILHECSKMLKDNRPTIDVGRKMLLKCSDGKIIELENSSGVGSSDYTFDVSGQDTKYTIYPMYTITKEDLLYIINHEVTNVRIETNLSLLNFGNTKFSKVLNKHLQDIEKVLKKKKGLYDGF